jgi:asparagine synthase (glutamine-hydrolysing)
MHIGFGIEKFLFRYAISLTNLLPQRIVWRPKEAFSDGVTTTKRSLHQLVAEYYEKKITNEEMQQAKANGKYVHCWPHTKEAFFYRKIFDEFFHGSGKCDLLVPEFW